MTDVLTRAEFDTEVTSLADRLARYAVADADDPSEPHNNPQEAIADNVYDVLDGHEWFSKSYNGPLVHGAIIEYALELDGVEMTHHDVESVVAGVGAAEAVKRVAESLFTSAVIVEARNRIPDHDGGGGDDGA